MSFFDSIDRNELKKMLELRVADGSLLRLIGKCLHVGVLDGAELSAPETGTAGALAVIGHVDLAWGFSIRPPGVGSQIGPIRNCLARILGGECIGNATRDLSERSAILSSELLDRIRASSGSADDQQIVWSWIERNDARSYVVLGDPAVRLRASELR